MVATEIRFFALRKKEQVVRCWIEVRTFFSFEDNNISVQYSITVGFSPTLYS